jgi:hypothetical protein
VGCLDEPLERDLITPAGGKGVRLEGVWHLVDCTARSAGNFSGHRSHYSSVRCGQVRVALSADIDGEGDTLRGTALAHLEDCPDCRRWRDAAHKVTRAARLGAVLPAPDLAARVVAGVIEDARQRRVRRYWAVVMAAVSAVGVVQVAVTVPLLLLAHGAPSGRYAGRVLGLVEAAIGAAFVLGSIVILWRSRDGSTLHVVDVRPAAEGADALSVEGRVA